MHMRTPLPILLTLLAMLGACAQSKHVSVNYAFPEKPRTLTPEVLDAQHTDHRGAAQTMREAIMGRHTLLVLHHHANREVDAIRKRIGNALTTLAGRDDVRVLELVVGTSVHDDSSAQAPADARWSRLSITDDHPIIAALTHRSGSRLSEMRFITRERPDVMIEGSPELLADLVAGLPTWGDLWPRRPLADLVVQHGLPEKLEPYRYHFSPHTQHDAYGYEHINPITREKVRHTVLVLNDGHVWRGWHERQPADHALVVIEQTPAPVDAERLIGASADPVRTRLALDAHPNPSLSGVLLTTQNHTSRSRVLFSGPRGDLVHTIEASPGECRVSLAFADDEGERLFTVELSGALMLGTHERLRLTIEDLLGATGDGVPQ